jgi:prolyl-tRNA synthetase
MLANEIIHASHPGGFHLLPLGLRAMEKLVRAVDRELQAIGAQKCAFTTLAPAGLWKKTGMAKKQMCVSKTKVG